MVGVIVLALGHLGVFHSIHEGNTIGRGGHGRRVLVIGVAMIFLLLLAARQDEPGVRRARPMRSPPPWCRSAGSHCCSPAPVDALQICITAPAKAGCYATNHGAGSDLRGIDTTMNAPSRDAKQIAWGDVGARQEADLAELADWVEGLRAAAHTARAQGNIALAEALDVTRFEVYEGYLDEELDHKQSQAAARRSR